MLRGSKNETLEKAFRRHQNPVAVQKNSHKFKSAASATAVPNTIGTSANSHQKIDNQRTKKSARYNISGFFKFSP